jgi:hypothetical protein
LAGATAFAHAAGAQDAAVRDPAGVPVKTLAAAVSAHGGVATWAVTGTDAYPATGMITVSVRPGAPVVCVKTPVPALGKAPEVVQTTRAGASSVVASGAVALFNGVPGTSCGVLVEGPATNLIPNPGAESSAAGWQAWNASTASVPAPAGLPARGGAGSLRVVAGQGGGSGQTPSAPVTPGFVYAASIWVYSVPSVTVCAGFDYYDAAGRYLWSGPCGSPTTVAGGWARLSLAPGAMPAGAYRAALFVAGPAHATYDLTAAQIEPGETVTSYGDGSLGPGYAWTAAADASSSVRADGAGVG